MANSKIVLVRSATAIILGLGALYVVPLAFADPPPAHDPSGGAPDTPIEADQLEEGLVTDGLPGQHSGVGGHLPGSSSNVELVGQVTVSGIVPGRISDVGVLGNFAYLGAFNQPCGQGGVYVVDISDPTNPTEVGFIPTAPGSFVGEGVQAIHLNTKKYKGDILVINNEICAITSSQIGGFSIFDVTNPLSPVPLVVGAGDPTPSPLSATNRIHSAFAWQQKKDAYVVIVDDEELADVDIFKITNPASPQLIAEVELADWPGAQDGQSAGLGSFPASFLHDMVVRKVRGDWLMLLSYWDAGFIVLNVNDPANPVFVEDTTYAVPDAQLGSGSPEGNGHQAEFSHNARFMLGADEDFSATRITSFTSSAFGGSLPATEGAFTVNIVNLPGDMMTGEVVHVGRGCPPDPALGIPAGDAYLANPTGKIALIERGLCRFDNKVAWAQLNGAVGAIVYNSAGGILTMGGDNPVQAGAPSVVGTSITIPGIFVHRTTGLALRDGTPPVTATATAEFDGWGYVHLFDARTLAEIDTYAVPEGIDPGFLRTPANPAGFGNLTVHEIATDPAVNLAYLSYYDAGFRVIMFGPDGIGEVGHFIDANGNDFWGVQVHRLPDGDDDGDDDEGETLILASDRDSGLWIFRYTGPMPEQDGD